MCKHASMNKPKDGTVLFYHKTCQSGYVSCLKDIAFFKNGKWLYVRKIFMFAIKQLSSTIWCFNTLLQYGASFLNDVQN